MDESSTMPVYKAFDEVDLIFIASVVMCKDKDNTSTHQTFTQKKCIIRLK